MIDKEIRWGVIGGGDVVLKKSGGPLNSQANSRWVALMRRNRKAAEYVAGHFAVPKVYDDAADLIADPEVNAVYVSTPPSSHASLAIAALEAGKHVYLEKPMAMDMQEASDILSASDNGSAKLVMAHYRRALPAFLKVGSLLAARAIGDVLFARIRIVQAASPGDSSISSGEGGWRLNPLVSGGGLFHDLAPHQLDLCLNWFGPVDFVSGISSKLLGGSSDDHVAAHLRFTSGVFLDGLWNFTADSAERSADEFEIFGSEGRISFSFFGKHVRVEKGSEREDLQFELPEWIQEPMIGRTVDYFLNGGDNPCPGTVGVETMRIMDRISGKS